MPSDSRQKGGTKMWCATCKKETVCKVIPRASAGIPTPQHQFRKAGTDVHWFERERQCLSCDGEFTTVEVSWDVLTELLKLREGLDEIAGHLEKLGCKTQELVHWKFRRQYEEEAVRLDSERQKSKRKLQGPRTKL